MSELIHLIVSELIHSSVWSRSELIHLIVWSRSELIHLIVWSRFDEQHQNCLSFCLSFVNRVLAAEGREALSREAFTQIFILPRVQRVQKYLFLYRHLQTHQYYLVDREEDTREDTQEEI
nr:MKRN2 opposite strand protein-like [Pseudochaenichthys georgianus]